MRPESGFDTRDVLFFPQRSDAVKALPTPKRHIAVVGNFPPTKCGIASFTADMVGSLRQAAPDAEIDIYAMASDPFAVALSTVRTQILEQDRASYRQAGIEIDRSGADVVWLQHEFGLFGGDAGEWIIDLLTPVAAPLVVTLHTVLESPTAAQRRVMDWLVSRASRLVVMSDEGKTILEQHYRADPKRVEIIPHGVPDRPFGRTAEMKAKFDLSARDVLMTFGLLSPGKGLETVISALPAIVREFPNTVYCIAGVTHPKLVAQEGEAYRERLQALASSLGVADNLLWVNRYLETDELLDLIEAADIYLTPYTDAGQSTSGTLSYAAALGKAVISTPYKHAVELLGDGKGIIVPFADPKSVRDAVIGLLQDRSSLHMMQRKAYAASRAMTWPAFGQRSLAVIDALRIDRSYIGALRVTSESGLFRLCDNGGMLQHSIYAVADRAHGYCIDDNARALMLAATSRTSFSTLAPVFAAFVQHGWNPDTRRFRNFMGYDRRWLEDAGSDDSCGRTLWAIGVTAAQARDAQLQRWARNLWTETAAIALEFQSPRAVAFATLGADAVLASDADDRIGKAIAGHGLSVLKKLYRDNARAGWRWFEPYLAYDNCRLPEAMLKAGTIERDDIAVVDAIEALEWIVQQQTAPDGHLRPIGSNAFGKSCLPDDPFDQQAVDAWATVDAAIAAYDMDSDRRWVHVAQSAFAWFFGRNDRGLALAEAHTGSCHDGLNPQGMNLNQGAESVLALHLAQARMKEIEGQVREGDASKSETNFPATA